VSIQYSGIVIVRSVVIFIVTLSLLFRLFRPVVAADMSGLAPTSTPSIEYQLPYPGLLPDHPLYIIKRFRDKILLLTARTPEKRVTLELLFADKHLSMGQILWERGNTSLAVSTIGEGEIDLLRAVQDLTVFKKQGEVPPGFIDKFELAARKHADSITRLIATANGESERFSLNTSLSTVNQAIQRITAVK
jgi:hypothetical protein